MIKMNKKIILKQGILLFLFIIVFIILINTVLGVSPFIQTSGEAGVLQISVPKPLIFALNSNITEGHIHVFNSTGYALEPITDVNCSVHIYNNLNKHVLEQNLTADENSFDMVITLDMTYFSEIGEYGFIIWCESGTEAGFTSTSFLVTRSGSEYPNQTALISVVIFIIGLTSLLFWFGSLLDSGQNKEWIQAIKLLVNIIALFMLLAGAGFVTRSVYILNYPQTLVNITSIVYFGLLFTIIPILLIFIVMFIKELLVFWTELKTGETFGK